MEKYSYFGERIRLYRKQRKESLADIARATKVSRAYVSKLEKGKSKPSEDILNSLISHFQLSGDGAFELVVLAGYKANTVRFEQPSELTSEDSKGKEVNFMEEGIKTQQIKIDVPKGTPVLYTDSAFVTLSQYGIVIDYAQTLASTNQQQVVARLGMSIDHAEALVKILTQKISEARLRSASSKKNQRVS